MKSVKIINGIKRKIEWVLCEANLILSLLITLVVAVVFAIIAVGTGEFIHRSKCLNNDNARRWHNLTCEEYQDKEWVKINPFKKNVIYYYNNNAEAIE